MQKKWQKSCKELKINLETFTKCGGSCQGCMLSKLEKNTGELWSKEQFNQLTPMIQKIIHDYTEKEDLFEVSLNLAPADHFLMPLNRIDDTVKWIKEAGLGRACGFITVSAVAKKEKIQEAVDAWKNAMVKYNQPICIDLVFEPSKINLMHFKDIYSHNIDYIHKYFGGVDLNINVGPDTVQAISPINLHQLMRENNFKNLTLNLIPNFETSQHFSQHWESIIQWMNEVLFSWKSDDIHGYNPCSAISPYIESISSYANIDNPLLKLIEEIKNKAKSEIYINSSGQVFFSQAGFGDLAHTNRFGFHPIDVDYLHTHNILQDLEKSALTFAAQNVKSFVNKTCMQCKYLYVCPRISMNVIKNVMQPHFSTEISNNSNSCPLKIKPLLESIDHYMQLDKDMTEYDKQREKFFISSGLNDTIIPHTRTLEQYTQHVILKN